MVSQTQIGGVPVLSALSAHELVSVARGPWRHESTSSDLSTALAAIDLLAGRALTDREGTAALLEVIKSANWWSTMERALEKFIVVGSVDHLQQLARWFYDYFWDPGEYGGGKVTPWRLKRVVERLRKLGVPPESAVPGVMTDCLKVLLDLGREYEAELQSRKGQ